MGAKREEDMIRKPPLSARGKAFLVLFGIALSCASLEIGLRVSVALRRSAREAAASGHEYWAIYDPDLLYRGNPKFPGMNSDGLRDHPIGPKGNRFRILMLGDSVGYYGDNVDDTMVAYLREELKSTYHAEIDVINACMNGYGTHQELVYLEKYGVAFHPDLVGVQFCVNDLHKSLADFQVQNGRLVPGTYGRNEQALQEARSWPKRLAHKSYLLLWLGDNFPIARAYFRWQVNHGFAFDYNPRLLLAWQDRPWNDFEGYLRQMAELGKQRGFKVFLAPAPYADQYQPAYLQRDRAYVLKPQQKLREICNRLGIAYYDPYSDLTFGDMKKDRLHLTQQGRVKMGRAIAHFLLSSGLLPQPPQSAQKENKSDQREGTRERKSKSE